MSKIEEIGNVAEKIGDAFDDNFTSKAEKLDASNKNTADARNLQRDALKQDDALSKRGIYYLAFFWSVVASLYLFGVTFFPIPASNERIADTVLGFLLGTIIASIINYFFGSSYGSLEKTKQNDGFMKRIFKTKQ